MKTPTEQGFPELETALSRLRQTLRERDARRAVTAERIKGRVKPAKNYERKIETWIERSQPKES